MLYYMNVTWANNKELHKYFGAIDTYNNAFIKGIEIVSQNI